MKDAYLQMINSNLETWSPLILWEKELAMQNHLKLWIFKGTVQLKYCAPCNQDKKGLSNV